MIKRDITFLVAALLIIFGTGYAIAQTAPNPGHSVNQIGAGQFGEVGDYQFPGTSRVGIGGAPSEDFHVSGTGDNKIVVESSDNHAAFRFKNDKASWILGVEDGSGRARIVEEGAGERLTILKGGNVGIGTSSPSETLDVAGDIQASGNICAGAKCIGGSSGTVGLVEANVIPRREIESNVDGVGSGYTTVAEYLPLNSGSHITLTYIKLEARKRQSMNPAIDARYVIEFEDGPDFVSSDVLDNYDSTTYATLLSTIPSLPDGYKSAIKGIRIEAKCYQSGCTTNVYGKITVKGFETN